MCHLFRRVPKFLTTPCPPAACAARCAGGRFGDIDFFLLRVHGSGAGDARVAVVKLLYFSIFGIFPFPRLYISARKAEFRVPFRWNSARKNCGKRITCRHTYHHFCDELLLFSFRLISPTHKPSFFRIRLHPLQQ